MRSRTMSRIKMRVRSGVLVRTQSLEGRKGRQDHARPKTGQEMSFHNGSVEAVMAAPAIQLILHLCMRYISSIERKPPAESTGAQHGKCRREVGWGTSNIAVRQRSFTPHHPLVLSLSVTPPLLHKASLSTGLVISHYATPHLGNWGKERRGVCAKGGLALWPAFLSISWNPLATLSSCICCTYI